MSADGGAGGGATSAAAAPAAGQQQAAAGAAAASPGEQFAQHFSGQQQQQQQPAQQGQAYYPEGLAEAMRGKSDRETIDKLYADISGRPRAPEKATDYKLELPAEFVEKFGDLKSDPVLPIWRQVSHELGLSNSQFQEVIPKLYSALDKAGLIDKPIDFDAEARKLEPSIPDRHTRIAKVAERVGRMSNLVRSLETRGVITKQEAGILSGMYVNADAVSAFEKVLALIPAEKGLQGGGTASGQGGTAHERALRAFYPSMFNN